MQHLPKLVLASLLLWGTLSLAQEAPRFTAEEVRFFNQPISLTPTTTITLVSGRWLSLEGGSGPGTTVWLDLLLSGVELSSKVELLGSYLTTTDGQNLTVACLGGIDRGRCIGRDLPPEQAQEAIRLTIRRVVQRPLVPASLPTPYLGADQPLPPLGEGEQILAEELVWDLTAPPGPDTRTATLVRYPLALPDQRTALLIAVGSLATGGRDNRGRVYLSYELSLPDEFPVGGLPDRVNPNLQLIQLRDNLGNVYSLGQEKDVATIGRSESGRRSREFSEFYAVVRLFGDGPLAAGASSLVIEAPDVVVLTGQSPRALAEREPLLVEVELPPE